MTHTVIETPPTWSISPPIETMVSRLEGTPFGNFNYGGLPAGVFNGYVRQSLNGGGTAFISASPGYAGKAWGSQKAISKVIVYGPTDRGYGNSPSCVNVTLSLYGKNGAPSNGTDGTLLGSVTFAQSQIDESVGRTITPTDQTTKYDHHWVRVDGGSIISTELSQVVMYENFTGPPDASLGYIKPAFIGDSIMYNMNAVVGSLPVPFAGAQIVAIGGSTIGTRFSGAGYIPDFFSSVAVGTTHLIIEGGVVDMANGTQYNAAITSGYTDILNRVPASMKVILLGIFQVDVPQMDISLPGYSATLTNPKIAAQNALINALAADYPNVVAATAVQSMSMIGKTLDGVHLAGSSYPAVGEMLKQYL